MREWLNECALLLRWSDASLGACTNVADFEKVKVIGAGTYGRVYMARHRRTGEIVALKRVTLHNAADGVRRRLCAA